MRSFLRLAPGKVGLNVEASAQAISNTCNPIPATPLLNVRIIPNPNGHWLRGPLIKLLSRSLGLISGKARGY